MFFSLKNVFLPTIQTVSSRAIAAENVVKLFLSFEERIEVSKAKVIRTAMAKCERTQRAGNSDL